MDLTIKSLTECFGPDKPLRDILPGDADDWRQSMIQKGLADNTVRRRCGWAKQLFRAAVRKGLVAANPFTDLKSAVQANSKRAHFITLAETKQVIDACPSAEWRLLFALSRFGGLRCPSETLGLTWQDVNWAEGRFLLHSPKTERHVGGESRIVPIFPELLPYLREAFEQAESGAERVFPRWQYRGVGKNLRTGLLRIIRRAGLVPWPKPFQNLRATRETELAETWPMHVVCAWIGNSPAVAKANYLQVTEDHFCRAAQNAAQYQAVSALPEREAEPGDMQQSPELPQDSESYATVHMEAAVSS
jgi:integrase